MQPIIMDQTPTTDRFFFVIVLPNKEREIGLLATGPLDTLDVQLVIDEQTFKQDGVRGSLIIAGKATLLLDPQEIIARFCPDNSEQTTKPSAVASKQRTILWVEDSQFFRSQVKKILEAEGYNVIEARDGIDAWNLLEKNSTEIDLVVTDLEMPNLDGIGLAKKIKSKKMFQNLPVIALTTLADEADFGKGKQAGIDEYLLKLDKEQFLACIRKFLAMIPSLAYKKVKKTKKRRNDDD
jgi:two-component system chemotaxis sensor kinase CheA